MSSLRISVKSLIVVFVFLSNIIIYFRYIELIWWYSTNTFTCTHKSAVIGVDRHIPYNWQNVFRKIIGKEVGGRYGKACVIVLRGLPVYNDSGRRQSNEISSRQRVMRVSLRSISECITWRLHVRPKYNNNNEKKKNNNNNDK